ncbi:immunity protein Imm33 domain-containing protein [Mesoterricola silvestris]|uniref:immunity protein Imm33 domain-containing protein n=1 Tax=Mesoterricola silvestris TaxID=2927979 RepID=UPI002931D1C4|nr:DUF2185 domain-containing protein [Mesoterricola silvestris]
MSRKNDRRSLIICSHVFEDGLPILRVKRDELDPDDPSDSGWQVVCDSGVRESGDTIRIISVEEAVAIDPSIEEMLDSEVGSVFNRKSAKGPWIKETLS